MDKTEFHRWAQQHQLPVPESYVVNSREELSHTLRHIEYPIVIKPLFRTPEWQVHSPVHKIIKLGTSTDIGNLPFDLFVCAPRFLVQRWIAGGDGNVHFCLVYVDRDGHELGYYTGRKLLQWPRLTGSTAIGIGTDDAEVHKLTQRALGAAGFRGLGSLEVKKSGDQYYITEPTVGRNNLQSYIAVAGGVNLTQTAFLDAIGQRRPVDDGHRKKAAWIEEYFAMLAVRDSVQQGDGELRNIVRAMTGRVSFASFSVSDPIPFVLLCREMLRGRMRRLSGGGG
jgi:predicted ATP-grasp superfamily ATP-dependent carboligase